MEDLKKQDEQEKAAVEDDYRVERMDESSVLHELEEMKELLAADVRSYKKEIEKLTAEIEGINISVSSAMEYMASHEGKRKEYLDNVERLKSRNETLIAEINNIKLKIKTDKEDEESVLTLRDSLIDELNSMESEKAIVIKGLDDLARAIKESSCAEERKLPYLKKCDAMLKEAYSALRGAENRMEISMKLKQK